MIDTYIIPTWVPKGHMKGVKIRILSEGGMSK